MAAFRRHAAAGRDRGRAVVRARDPFDGRALRRARRDDPRAPEPRAPAHLEADRHDDRVRHAQHSRGGLPLDACRRDVRTAGSDRRAHPRRSPSAAQRPDPGERALLRLHHPRSRTAAWPRGWAPGRRPGRGKLSKRIAYYFPAIAVFVGVLGMWELAVRALGIQQFLLPPPSSIASAFVEHFDELMTVGRNTFVEAVGGLLIGGAAALLVAFATARWATASRALLPFAIAANSVPIIAFAPIMNNWFGILNPLSKMMVVAVLVFFPIMINTLRGLTLVDQASLELMRSYAASELAIFAKVRVPNALPYIFTALKVSATLSLIGAIVAEYFGGSRSVLGQFIITEAAFFRFANAWAAIVVASAVSIAFFLIIVAIERVAIPWHASARIADSS